MDRLRVCLVIPTLDRGGAEKQLCLLAAGLDRTQFDPHVLCLTRGGPREEMLRGANVPYTIVGKSSKLDPRSYLRLAKAMSEFQPDIVHTWLFAANAYGRFAALRQKVPVVLGGERCVDPWKRSYQFWIDRYLAKRTSGIVTNSRGVVDFYRSHGIDQSHFHVIPNGVEEPKTATPVRYTREEVCRLLGVPPERKLVAIIGRLWPQKGHRDLFWAAELLRVARNDLSVIVIGDGPLRKRLELYVDQLRAADTVRFVGERNDIGDLLPHIDVLLNGSLYEGQSNSILEAMSVGVPVVASDIPGNRDLVVQEETGYLFPLGDTHQICKYLNTLLSDSELAKRLGKAGQDRIRSEFAIPKMIKAHEELYRRLVRDCQK